MACLGLVHVLLVLICGVQWTIAMLLCYECTNVTTLATCHTPRECPEYHQCTSGSNPPGSPIVGRSVISSTCSQCCDVSGCNMNMCSLPTHVTTGGWSDWGSWAPCSRTCGGGIRSKSRTCTNPAPSAGGLGCIGNSDIYSECTIVQCSKTPDIYFKVRTPPTTGYMAGDTVKFNTTVEAVGGAYNSSTGRYTVPLAGVYMFQVQTCTYSALEIVYNIMAVGRAIATSVIGDNGYYMKVCSFGSGTARLAAGDGVWVQVMSVAGRNGSHDNHWSSFSGILVHT